MSLAKWVMNVFNAPREQALEWTNDLDDKNPPNNDGGGISVPRHKPRMAPETGEQRRHRELLKKLEEINQTLKELKPKRTFIQ